MQLEIIILNELNQNEDKYHMTSLIFSLKYGTNRPIYKITIDLQTWRTDLWLPRGREGVGWTGSLGLVDSNYDI